MIRFIFCVALMMLGFAVAGDAQAQAKRASTIAVVVNQGAVTASEIEGRMRLIMASSGMPDNKETRDRIRPQIINMLVDENLMMQEAGRLGLSVEKTEIQGGFAALAQQNNFTPDQFREILRNQNIPMRALESQIAAQIAWSKVIQSEIHPKIQITDNQVDAVMDSLLSNRGQREYLISEIYLPVESPQQEKEVRQLADRLAGQLVKGDVPFQAIARQFSQSASAARAGDVGWVEASQLAEEVAAALEKMKQGTLSNPVRSLSGYHIVLLRDQRVISDDTMPSRDEVMNRIGMEQLDRMQRRYLLDLKSAAFIERRV